MRFKIERNTFQIALLFYLKYPRCSCSICYMLMGCLFIEITCESNLLLWYMYTKLDNVIPVNMKDIPSKMMNLVPEILYAVICHKILPFPCQLKQTINQLNFLLTVLEHFKSNKTKRKNLYRWTVSFEGIASNLGL